MKCERCKNTVKKGKHGYPILDRKTYCSHCFEFLQWKNKTKREVEKRCQKN